MTYKQPTKPFSGDNELSVEELSTPQDEGKVDTSQDKESSTEEYTQTQPQNIEHKQTAHANAGPRRKNLDPTPEVTVTDKEYEHHQYK